MSSRWLWAALLVVALFGAALVAPAWSAAAHHAPATRFTDGHLLGIALWGEALRRGELPGVTTDLVAWPGGADVRILLWPSALLGAITGAPIALTLSFALTPAFNLLGGWVLGAALGRPVPGRLVLGGLLAAHPWVIETLTNGQVEQAVLGGAALQVAAGIWATNGEPSGLRRALLPGLVTALVGWAAPHVALAGCLVLGLLLLGRARTAPVPTVAVLISVALGALAVNAWHAPAFAPGTHVFSPKGSEGRPTALVDLPEFASLRGLLLPPSRSELPVLHPNWLGAVALFAALASLRSASRVAARAPLFAAVVLTILALGPRLGPVPLPWALLAELAPTVAQSMSAYRMVIGVVLALAVAASAVLWGRWAPLVVLAALVEGPAAATRPLPLPAEYVPFDAGTAERRAHTGAVLDLPLAGPSCPKGAAHYLLQAARTGRPVPLLLTNARAGYAAIPGITRTFGAPAGCGELREDLRKWGFTGVVLHVHDPDCPASPALRGCLSTLGPGQEGPGAVWWEL